MVLVKLGSLLVMLKMGGTLGGYRNWYPRAISWAVQLAMVGVNHYKSSKFDSQKTKINMIKKKEIKITLTASFD